jgi:hypothetical protein
MTALYDWPVYRSHKLVRAAQIDSGVVMLADGKASMLLAFHDEAIVDQAVVARYKPVPGDYLVQYEDGYLSISPKAAFEGGYTFVPSLHAGDELPVTGLDFGAAIRRLKRGQRVARVGWNGKGMWLTLFHVSSAIYSAGDGTHYSVLPCIAMKTADGKLCPGWLASQTDMLAEDWMVVGAPRAASPPDIDRIAADAAMAPDHLLKSM